jgi:hypothetical protein
MLATPFLLFAQGSSKPTAWLAHHFPHSRAGIGMPFNVNRRVAIGHGLCWRRTADDWDKRHRRTPRRTEAREILGDAAVLVEH